MIGNTEEKKEGWTQASEIQAVEIPTAYGPAPTVSFTIKDMHRQCKIKFKKIGSKQAD